MSTKDEQPEGERGCVDVLVGENGRFALGMDGDVFSFDAEAFRSLGQSMIECVDKHTAERPPGAAKSASKLN
jgi:hypothetical protein